MSSYWKVDDTMRIGQKYISIPSENGLDYSPEQKIQLFVDASTKFMSGQDSYLEFNLKLKMPAGSVPTKLQLDQLGGNALIRNIRIYDGSRGVLLEEIESYSSLCSVRYDYDTDDSTRNYRALREGSGVHNIANRGTRGTSHSVMANTLSNPYFKQVSGTQTLAGTHSTQSLFPFHRWLRCDSCFVAPRRNGSRCVLCYEPEQSDGCRCGVSFPVLCR